MRRTVHRIMKTPEPKRIARAILRRRRTWSFQSMGMGMMRIMASVLWLLDGQYRRKVGGGAYTMFRTPAT